MDQLWLLVGGVAAALLLLTISLLVIVRLCGFQCLDISCCCKREKRDAIDKDVTSMGVVISPAGRDHCVVTEIPGLLSSQHHLNEVVVVPTNQLPTTTTNVPILPTPPKLPDPVVPNSLSTDVQLPLMLNELLYSEQREMTDSTAIGKTLNPTYNSGQENEEALTFNRRSPSPIVKSYAFVTSLRNQESDPKPSTGSPNHATGFHVPTKSLAIPSGRKKKGKKTRWSQSYTMGIIMAQQTTVSSTQAELILAVDATPTWFGGYLVNPFERKISYYSIPFNRIPWNLRDRSRRGKPEEFEMKNMLCALLQWSDTIVGFKCVQIYTDNFAINDKTSEYGGRVRDFMRHLTACESVTIANGNAMVLGSNRRVDEFEKYIGPADHLSRRRVQSFKLSVLKMYSYVTVVPAVKRKVWKFWEEQTLLQLKSAVSKWSMQKCPKCGFTIRHTGSFKEGWVKNGKRNSATEQAPLPLGPFATQSVQTMM